jgi:hypothetical protein
VKRFRHRRQEVYLLPENLASLPRFGHLLKSDDKVLQITQEQSKADLQCLVEAK